MFAMGGPVRMEEGGTPGGIIAAAQAMGISLEELMEKIRRAQDKFFYSELERKAFNRTQEQINEQIRREKDKLAEELSPRLFLMTQEQIDQQMRREQEALNRAMQDAGNRRMSNFELESIRNKSRQDAGFSPNSFLPRGMKEGGAAFPDLTGDGQVTQADI